MPQQNPLPRLREIRDQQRRAQALIAERDHLIRVAATQGLTERQIAEASGLSQPRVHRILITR
jgi:DNA-binding transcriptional regulator LsrR (DeoR family)